ncbi:methylenetetrahydrofolate reductase [NAD(P)H] [sulfur-oxidizing endosymbiont of Gigantopelta aegis]|uniref:methylenetetrahydrofolate reductase [NAD(P)H] n=1 Tax=sulfur-oxidizing endosymbiont of Gigantopelta aegis TaxID=2794934 RepID=UPI0018DB7F12|nr:methylenetetrahydrofolate reductase [NAD(P)H] [sulfur-oxidizing endosymbiont of Gigantopelta aegis]
MTTTKQTSQPISFEFFPTKTAEGAEKLALVRDKLSVLDPLYYSVTYGAGGSTQEGTLNTIKSIMDAGYSAAPHLSCIGSTHEGIKSILDIFMARGVKRIVALRGDLPSGHRDVGEFRYANELVEFIRSETNDHFHIEVAAYPEVHPQARDANTDLKHFIAKMNAGANSAITQYFFNIDAYLYFVDSCQKAGMDKPIVPGIMPISNYSRLAGFSDMCGAEIPRWLAKRLQGYGDDIDSIKALGLEVISKLCEQLLAAGAPGLHFYTLNQSKTTLQICENLGLKK